MGVFSASLKQTDIVITPIDMEDMPHAVVVKHHAKIFSFDYRAGVHGHLTK